ncbi:dihydropyrimidinase [Capronia epimyces CBS 606.96]|uniref:dihydropyrimidinase n=1 Tax=Capronia epimyces CBS 606.96 TaxID=1182542 RepID=W9XEY9_9EURO|nr:dihydropyrimidinase [Capronia epimyces CBS 606.96]EXJ79072.1 dihydropyrimidinase [Capronia epimyces CBS 606.96]
MDLDLIVRNGTVVTASDIWTDCDIGIKNGSIVAVARGLPATDGVEILDAEGAYITPGGIDTHVHLSQLYEASVGGLMKTQITNGQIPDLANYTNDTYDTGTRSAVAGGTTTVITFASQLRDDESLVPVLEEYYKLADGQSYCDYAFHMILSNPTKHVLEHDLPMMVEKYGITSVKIYMTYKAFQLRDYQILDVMHAARKLGITTMVHAENADVIDWMTEHLEEQGMTAPYHHGTSRPPIVEAEATNRAIVLSELMDTPILLVHISGGQATRVIHDAKSRLLPVHGETCPQYLFLLAESMKKAGFEGAKCVCSPPIREEAADQDAIWTGLANGTFTTLSSDHAPIKFDHPGGKLLGLSHGGGPQGKFQYIPNGLPGVETRVPLLWSGGVLTGRITPQKFVEVTATNPAKLYGLTNKGTIGPGFDADLTIWYPQETFKPFKLTNEMLHHAIDYTPFEGVEFKNWPRYTLVRGKVVFKEGKVVGDLGYGQYQKRTKSTLAGPRNRFLSEWRPKP